MAMRIRIKPVLALLDDGRAKPVAVLRATERIDPETLRASGWASPHRPGPGAHTWRITVTTDGHALINDGDLIFYAGPFLDPDDLQTAEWLHLFGKFKAAGAMVLLDPGRSPTISREEIAQAHEAGNYLHITLPTQEHKP